MARLPDYTALGEAHVPQAPSGVASYQPPDRGGVARAVHGMGRELEATADIMVQANERQDHLVAEDAFNRLHAQSLQLKAGEGGFQSVKGAGVLTEQFVSGYEERFSSAAGDIERTLTNDNQRRLFQQRVPIAQQQFQAHLYAHKAQQTDLFNDHTELATIDLARRQVFDNPTDAMAVTAGLSRIDKTIDDRSRRLGWSAEQTAEAKRTYQEKVFEDAATIMVEANPVLALQAMNKRFGIGVPEAGPSGIAPIDGLNIGKLRDLRQRAVSYITQADTKLKTEEEKRLREAESATKELRTFSLSGQNVSPEYEQSVLAKVAGTPFEPAVRQMVQASHLGAMHGSQTLPKQRENLRTMDALVAAKGSDPEQSRFVSQAREITQTQEAAYKDNPWAAATRFGHQPDVPQVQLSGPGDVPKLVAQRLPLMTGTEIYAGQPVSPLQPAEAKAAAQMLKTLPPDQRAEVLAQTGAALSLPRAEALARQLDEHDKPLALALRMGMDRTTAGRASSSLVLLGAQALADKTVKRDDQALAGWRAEIASLVRGTLGDERAENDVIEAAYLVRAAQDREGIAAPGFTGIGNGAADALAMVIGRPLERGGMKTFLPRGMKEGDFDAKLRAYTPERLRQMATPATGTDVQRALQDVLYVRGAPVPVSQIAAHLGEYGLRRDGAGRYIPVVRNAPITLDAQGTQLLRLEVK